MKAHIIASVDKESVADPVGAGLLLQNPQKVAGLWLGAPTDFGAAPAGVGVGLRLIDPQGESGLILGSPVIEVTPPIPVSPPTINSVVYVSDTSLGVYYFDNQTVPADSFNVTVTEVDVGEITGSPFSTTDTPYVATGLTVDTAYEFQMTAVVGEVQSGLSNAVQGTTTAPVVGDIDIAYDNFESGDLSYTGLNNNFYWTPGPTFIAGDIAPFVSSKNPYSGTYSCEFTFGGSADVDANDASSELRFYLNQKYPEVWMEFQLYLPDGTEGFGSAEYKVRDQGYEGTRNNKIARLYYSKPDTTAGDIAAGASTRIYSLANETAYLFPEFKGTWPFGGSNNESIQIKIPLTTGVWHKITMHFRGADFASGSPVANTSVVQMWLDDTNIFDGPIPDMNELYGIPEMYNSFGFGYVLGYANTGFDDTTILFVDEFKLSTQPLI